MTTAQMRRMVSQTCGHIDMFRLRMLSSARKVASENPVSSVRSMVVQNHQVSLFHKFGIHSCRGRFDSHLEASHNATGIFDPLA